LVFVSVLGSGLPHRKADTYDLFELEKYDHSAYNSIMYFLALRVMQRMGSIKNDQKTLRDVNRALERAEKLFDVEMWDQKKGIILFPLFFACLYHNTKIILISIWILYIYK